ncbi:MAG: sugar kinase [Methylocystis sp.]|nr:sugar kinase [Methylocystis sp.]MCA3583912.1 sugar kinase [Methylocystis sp.]MCA3588433.1 sugar kinase [Methylocystis sp.]MCA3592416.1 sugar kinase [Methylocystis sp.]
MASVLSIGISTLDYVFQVDAMPMRAEKYRSRQMAAVGGGIAANASVAVARQGGRSHLITRLGDDAVGRSILDELQREGVDVRLSRQFPGHRSPLSCILVDRDGERMIISYSDPDLPETAEWLPQRLPAGINAVLGDTRWEAGARHMFALAREASAIAVLDADRKPQDDALLGACSHAALSAQACLEITGEHDAAAGLAALRRRYGNWLAVTDGARGVFWTDGGTIRHTPAFLVDAVDTLGAGDAWHGAFALGLAEGMDEARAVSYASAVAALKCTRFGGRSGIPDRAEVETFLKENA